MPAEPFFERGTKVVGNGTFEGLKGKVVNTKETGFGKKFALVESKDGKMKWARTIYLTEKDKS